MKKKHFSLIMAGGFALLNVIMYFSIKKFWIGGSSFLPLIGNVGANSKFLVALTVNIGILIGSFISAKLSGEFILRLPRAKELPKFILAGFLVGIGITLNPGTCTTAFVTGMPMLSVSSFLSAAGIFLGGYFVYNTFLREK